MVVIIQIDISTSLIFESNSNKFLLPFTFKQQVKTEIEHKKQKVPNDLIQETKQNKNRSIYT